MSKQLKYYALLFMLLRLQTLANAQQCSLIIKGLITNVENKPLTGAGIIIDSSLNFITTAEGSFNFGNICPGNHQVIVSFLGYDTIREVLNVNGDTVLSFILQKAIHELANVTVVTSDIKKQPIASLAVTNIKGTELFQSRGNTLGESLKSIPGLNSLQTGPSLSKPIIHGLHSNRVLILNNGVRQEGQQWGSEHAPEIDPFIASNITIVKGAASVRYGSDAIVGVIILEPPVLAPQKKLDGELNLVAASNGRMGVASAMLQGKFDKGLSGLNWRLQGTLKRAGNFKTANYYLKNSGLFEGDYSATINYRKEHYGAELYYSSFYNKVGIFEGSHVGNVTDLYAAFKRTTPITASYFTYDINRTYQNVHHNLFKGDAYYNLGNGGKLEAVYAIQRNKRDEYDIDLPYSTDPNILKEPQISFRITTATLDLLYQQPLKNNWSGTIGVSGQTQSNVFRGIRYLVPNFRNYGGGFFAIEKYALNKFNLEAGVRYDYRWLRVYQLNNTTLQSFYTTKDYNNITGTLGATYQLNKSFSVNANIGTAWRAPSVNELYINGIHLSAASYEKGDSNLVSERSYNFTVSLKYETKKFAAELVGYDNIINNFIYAKPTLKPITLISGTYPYFVYTQENVNLKGIDLDFTFKPFKKISVESKTSVVRGWNRTIKDHLIFMPADRFDNTIKYSIDKWKNANNLYISLQNITVLKQTRVPPNSDYVDPPQGYSLFNANIGITTKFFKKPSSIDFGAYNFTNVAYRDYLNRFRYYADDLGISLVLKTKINF